VGESRITENRPPIYCFVSKWFLAFRITHYQELIAFGEVGYP